MRPDAIVKLIESHRFDTSDENTLQAGLAALFTDADVAFKREVRLSAADRIDFLLPSNFAEALRRHQLSTGIGVEVKVKGSLAALVRQLHRYAQSSQIEALVLVTSKLQLARVPQSLNAKPIHVAALIGGVG